MRVCVIGAGIAGLVASYWLAKAGHSVTLYERGDRVGGLAGSFSIADGLEIEKYYHFICAPDQDYFEMQRELGIDHLLRWRTTRMGLFFGDGLYQFGDPLSLLRFPHLTLRDKVRFGLAALRSKRRGHDDWRDLENIPARDWLTEQYGERALNVLYEPLLTGKFGDVSRDISAAWMWARLFRVANSRTILQQERLGYLDGGSQAYIDALEARLHQMDVAIHLSSRVRRVVVEHGAAAGVEVHGSFVPFDSVLSTVPIPRTLRLFEDLEGAYFDNLRSLEYMGVMVLMLRLKRRFSRYFWMNINDPRTSLTGIIEYTNLNPYPGLGGDAILYIPEYLPDTHPRFGMTDDDLIEGYLTQLRLIRAEFDESWVRQVWLHRDRHAQPVCRVGFAQHIPSMQTPVPNLFLTDSYQLHPHDRSISDSTRLGMDAARLMLERPMSVASYQESPETVAAG